jgi:hypothetical protein
VSDNNKHDAIPGDTNSITSETEEITKMWHWGKIFYLIFDIYVSIELLLVDQL